VLAGPPSGDVEVPAAVVAVAHGRAVRPVWANQLGGLTFEVGSHDRRCFVKWAPLDSGLDLGAEAERMAWVRPFSPVPEVIDTGGDGDGTWLCTAPLPGESAVSERGRRDPALAVAAIGAALRHLHDRAPVGSCPFSWSVDHRISTAHRRAADGTSHAGVWHECHRRFGLGEALAILDDPPPVDRLVVCHGDACAPNTLVDGGSWSGHVDLGSLGVADRWADLAVATWSTEWNYGPGWEQPLLDAYGIDPDPERTACHRLLWDLS
jgi:aminoglycoside phosphotransferase